MTQHCERKYKRRTCAVEVCMEVLFIVIFTFFFPSAALH